MDIQIRFEDGTVEMRADWSPCMPNYNEPTLKHPSEERWYRWFYGLSFCGYEVLSLASCRGGHMLVWRITGQDIITKALIGAWQSCRVETWAEQVERLTRERDAERARADQSAKDLDAATRAVAAPTVALMALQDAIGRVLGARDDVGREVARKAVERAEKALRRWSPNASLDITRIAQLLTLAQAAETASERG